jgi:dienelactone hydrolase
MHRVILSGIVAVLWSLRTFGAMSVADRQAQLDWMLKNLPAVPTWNEWQQKTGELPPDLDSLPRANFLPDPLHFFNGRPVNVPVDWPARRTEIRQLFEKWVIGSIPPKPTLDNIIPLDETRGSGYVTRNVRLEFGPERKATAQVTVTIPDGAGPFPVLIGAGWTGALLRRGYISCSFNDSVDQRSNLPELYPDFDFATMGQRAWTAQLVVDYLFTLPQVDKTRIAITGYSRGGKMATIAAALDERIGAVIAGSTGVGGVLPWRLSGERGMGEGIESTTRMFPLWFTPRLRFFSGREDRLPVDANLLVALVAPRACLMEYGLNDEVSNVWGDEQCYHSAQKVYQALAQPDRLGLLRVPGFHGANDQEACLDWLDLQFGRSNRKWDNHLLFTWDFDQWVRNSGESVDLNRFPQRGSTDLLAKTGGGQIASTNDWETKAVQIRKSVEWLLGDAPVTMPAGAGRGFGARGFGGRGGPAPGPTAIAAGGRGNPGQLGPDVPAWVIARGSQEFGWPESEKNQIDSRRIRFGYNVTGDLYFPSNTPANTKLPTVIWLHGYSYPLGYMWVYRRDLHPILALVKAGYAVLAFDQCGFGSRMNESGPFYDRYPHWSQLGRMIEDTRAAIDTLEKDDLVDPQRIYLFGYTLGGMVALHTAALDPRVKGVVAISGFTPMRTDTAERGTEGLARLSRERPLLPRVGFFIGHEAQVPYDYNELLAAIAPRPVLVVQPQMDRDTTSADVHAAVDQARKVYSLYGATDQLALQEPQDYQRLPTATQDRIVQWMKDNLNPKEPR